MPQKRKCALQETNACVCVCWLFVCLHVLIDHSTNSERAMQDTETHVSV